MHGELSGVAHEAELTLWIENAVDIRLTGSLLWTHFGISGPLALNMSRHLLRAILEGRRATLTVSFCPGQTFDTVERWWTSRTAERPQASVSTPLSTLVPASVAEALLKRCRRQRRDTTLAHFARDDRRRLSHALVTWPLRVKGDRAATTTPKSPPAASRSTRSIRRR